jgi:hypothetical protein
MTANQSTALVKNPNTKKAMAVLAKFAKKELAYKEAEKEAKAATELIKEAMIAGGVDKVNIDIPGFTGYITLATRTTYKADDLEQVAEEFLKPALDSDKVKAQAVLTGMLPEGISKQESQYITKKFKAVE